MKAVILAGGFGTRISEETALKPKPMIEIGGKPILWHILKMYSAHGIHDFIICCGYKGYVIKEYFANYFLHTSDVTFDMAHNRMEVHHQYAEPWRVTLVDTGENTMTGGRLKRVAPYLQDDDAFCIGMRTALLPDDLAGVDHHCADGWCQLKGTRGFIIGASGLIGDGLNEALSMTAASAPVLRIGVEDRFSQYCGSYEYLLKEHGLDAESVHQRINAFVASTHVRVS